MNELTPEQMAKLAKWLPDLVHFNGINLQYGIDLQWWHNTALGRSVHETEFDYLCRLAEERLGQVDLVVEFLNKLRVSLKQPASDYDMMQATPAQRVNALPEPKG